jgi:MinD superfamily P-loop ATPase
MPRQELPIVDQRLCTLCGDCQQICPTDALQVRDFDVCVWPAACVSCTVCEAVCPVAAIAIAPQDW